MGIIRGNDSYYFRKNLQGDIIELLDKDGNVEVKYVYNTLVKVLK